MSIARDLKHACALRVEAGRIQSAAISRAAGVVRTVAEANDFPHWFEGSLDRAELLELCRAGFEVHEPTDFSCELCAAPYSTQRTVVALPGLSSAYPRVRGLCPSCAAQLDAVQRAG